MRLPSIFLITALLFLTACSLLPEQIDATRDWSANKLYSEAKEQLNQKNYEQAIKYFEILEARYPFGRYAQQAQLEIAYAYYKYDEPDLAIAAADRFIKIYPRHRNVDYAWYIKGLTNYNRGKSIVDRYLPQEPAERDTFNMQAAYNDFEQLMQRYPESIYSQDSAQRLIHLRNNMAEYEIHVADYYMRRNAWVAAANRGKYVIENFQRTPSVPDALAIMVMAYRELDADDLADDVLRVLSMNYPDDPETMRLQGQPGNAPGDQESSFWKFW
jgi:outer membrane protein assembly factor BamD